MYFANSISKGELSCTVRLFLMIHLFISFFNLHLHGSLFFVLIIVFCYQERNKIELLKEEKADMAAEYEEQLRALDDNHLNALEDEETAYQVDIVFVGDQRRRCGIKKDENCAVITTYPGL